MKPLYAATQLAGIGSYAYNEIFKFLIPETN